MTVDVMTLGGLFAVALTAGVIDAMAGGGGLLTVPALMSTGIPPLGVLATNKLQGVFSSLSAAIHFWRKGHIDIRHHWRPALASFAGAMGGAISVSLIDPSFLKTLVPFLLIGIALWVFCSPKLGHTTGHSRLSASAFNLGLVPAVGFYDGFLGPGTGTFFALGAVFFRGQKLNEATVQAKLYNLMSNIGALIFFLISGHVVWMYGIVMAVGMMIGGTIGAKLILTHGTALIRPLVVVMSLAMSLKLLWQQGLLQSLLP